MDRNNNFKKNIWLGIYASCFLATCVLLLAVSFLKPYEILKRIQPQGLSFIDSLIVANYMFLFMFLVFLIPSLFVSFIFRKPLKIFQAQLFLFSILASLSFAGFIYSEKISRAASRNLLLPLFYILLPFAILVIYKRVYKTVNLQKLILVTLAGVIILSLSGIFFDFKQWVLSFLIKKYILLGLTVSVLAILVMALGCFFTYRLLTWLVSKSAYLTEQRKPFIFERVLAVLLLVSCSVATLDYLWENRQNFKIISSRTAKDTNVILIIIDALRPDHLGCYGYTRETSPAIDGLAKEGVLFKNCYSATSYTKSSVASIMTSLYQSMHGLTLRDHALPESLTTLAEVLRDNGYVTYADVTNPLVSARYNYDQGFDFFQDNLALWESKSYYIPFVFFRDMSLKLAWLFKINLQAQAVKKGSVNRKAISWLAKFKHKNFFMLMHCLDPHKPYGPPEPYNKMFLYPAQDKNSETVSLYDGEIRFVDDFLGDLFARLKSWQVYDNTLIIITADHGEAFGEHNFTEHANSLYREEIKVPLIIKLSRFLPQVRVVESQVRSIDIMPTILDILGISYSGNLEGKSLLPMIQNDEKAQLDDYIFVEMDDKDWFRKAIIKNNEWKLIFSGNETALKDIGHKENLELYNLKADPGEKSNLVAQEQKVLDEMLGELERYIRYCQTKATTPPIEIESDNVTIRRLRALGYAQ